MSKYKLHYTGKNIVQPLENGSIRYIPISDDNGDYQEYQRWLLIPGNVPDPADPPPPPDPQAAIDKDTLGSLASQYTTLKNGMASISNHMDGILADPASPSAARVGTDLKTIAQDMKTTMVGLGMILDTIAIFARRGN